MNEPAALRPGSTGEAVRDLQRRLGALGYDVSADRAGSFGESTATALSTFQDTRGLRRDGVCDQETWSALVESGYTLGDRLLYRANPMLRGDDVRELQRRLNALGFDAWREDGILGDRTAAGLTEFQRNAGITADGVCGPETLSALARVSGASLVGLVEGSVASVRERESLRRGPHTLTGRRVFIGTEPGFERLAAAIVRALLSDGAEAVLDATGADGPRLASAANRYRADLFLALAAGDAPGWRCSYFESGRFRSEGGYLVARAVRDELTPFFATSGTLAGRTYSALRETTMVAVICEPAAHDDPSALAVIRRSGDDVAEAIVRGVRRAMGQFARAGND